MKKKNLAVLATAVTVIAALAVGVTACKGKKDDDNTKDDVTTESATTEEETTTEEDTTEETTEETSAESESTAATEAVKSSEAMSELQNEESKAADATKKDSTKETTVAATTKAPTATEYSWSGYYESEGNAGSTQFHIKKSGSGFEITGDGIDGDKYGEIAGALVKVNDSTYKYKGENGTLTLRYKNGTITVKQSGTVGDEGFDFSGTYQKTRTTEE